MRTQQVPIGRMQRNTAGQGVRRIAVRGEGIAVHTNAEGVKVRIGQRFRRKNRYVVRPIAGKNAARHKGIVVARCDHHGERAGLKPGLYRLQRVGRHIAAVKKIARQKDQLTAVLHRPVQSRKKHGQKRAPAGVTAFQIHSGKGAVQMKIGGMKNPKELRGRACFRGGRGRWLRVRDRFLI